MCGLNELFRVGQPVRCKIVDSAPRDNSKRGMWKPKLTINPKEVNENLTASSLKANLVWILNLVTTWFLTVLFKTRVATAQGKQVIWLSIFLDRENSWNVGTTHGKFRHNLGKMPFHQMMYPIFFVALLYSVSSHNLEPCPCSSQTFMSGS